MLLRTVFANSGIICSIGGGDHIDGMTQINVAAQATTQSFTVAIINDDTVECVEAFSVVILSVTTCGVTISNNRAEMMITDDDGEQKFCDAIIIICDLPRENRPSSHLVMIVEIPVLKFLISVTSFCSC